jgi:hypothetical protein
MVHSSNGHVSSTVDDDLIKQVSRAYEIAHRLPPPNFEDWQIDAQQVDRLKNMSV